MVRASDLVVRFVRRPGRVLLVILLLVGPVGANCSGMDVEIGRCLRPEIVSVDVVVIVVVDVVVVPSVVGVLVDVIVTVVNVKWWRAARGRDSRGHSTDATGNRKRRHVRTSGSQVGGNASPPGRLWF